MKPGDIVLVRFPQTDLQAGKLRPALVLAISPGPYRDVLLAMITSRPHQIIHEFDEVIEPTDPDYPDSGLKTHSIVRLSRLASVETSVINAKLGEISLGRLDEAKKRVINWLKQ